MARVNTKIGDIFSVELVNNKKYFQYIANDLTQLNSDVIRAFKEVYTIDATPILTEVVKGEIDFYAHCVTKFGIKLGFWEKVGNVPDVGDLSHILFRDSNDCGNPEIKVSYSWYIWRINDNNFTRVGRLEEEDRKAEIGIVISPDSIVHRMKTGDYDFVYSSYE